MAHENGGQAAPKGKTREIPVPHVRLSEKAFDAFADTKERPEPYTVRHADGREEEKVRMVKKTAYYVVGQTSAGDVSGVPLDGWELMLTVLLDVASKGPDGAFERAMDRIEQLRPAINAVRTAKAAAGGGRRLEIHSLLKADA